MFWASAELHSSEYRFPMSWAGSLAWADVKKKEDRGVTTGKKYACATGRVYYRPALKKKSQFPVHYTDWKLRKNLNFLLDFIIPFGTYLQ